MKLIKQPLIAIMCVTAVVSLILGGLGAYFKIKVPEMTAEILFGLMIFVSIGCLGQSNMRMVLSIGQLTADITKLKAEVEAIKKDLSSHRE